VAGRHAACCERCTATPRAYDGVALCVSQVSVYGLATCAEPEAVSAAGGDFAALLSTQSTTGMPWALSVSSAGHQHRTGGLQLCAEVRVEVYACSVGALSEWETFRKLALHHPLQPWGGFDPSSAHLAGPPKPLARVPAWLKRPVAGHLGFGGKLAALTNAQGSMQPGPDKHAAVTARIDVKQVSRFGQA